MNDFSTEHQKTLFYFSKALAEALRLRDAYTRLHSDRVVFISKKIAIAAGLSSKEIELLNLASAMHDIGKIAIPDSVLMKPAGLTDSELAIMRNHASLGADVIRCFDHNDAEDIAEAIRHHHEWFDGTGYPGNLRGETIPILSRIITIADNYDAMAVRRVYQSEKLHSHILSIMEKESGQKLDPVLFGYFKKLIDLPENASVRALDA